MQVAFNDYYTGAGHEFDTTRKAGYIAEALVGLTNIEVVDPKDYVALAEQIIEAIHDEEYLDALRTGEPRSLASSQVPLGIAILIERGDLRNQGRWWWIISQTPKCFISSLP